MKALVTVDALLRFTVEAEGTTPEDIIASIVAANPGDYARFSLLTPDCPEPIIYHDKTLLDALHAERTEDLAMVFDISHQVNHTAASLVMNLKGT